MFHIYIYIYIYINIERTEAFDRSATQAMHYIRAFIMPDSVFLPLTLQIRMAPTEGLSASLTIGVCGFAVEKVAYCPVFGVPRCSKFCLQYTPVVASLAREQDLH